MAEAVVHECPMKQLCQSLVQKTGQNTTCYHPVYYIDQLERKCELLTRSRKVGDEQAQAPEAETILKLTCTVCHRKSEIKTRNPEEWTEEKKQKHVCLICQGNPSQDWIDKGIKKASEAKSRGGNFGRTSGVKKSDLIVRELLKGGKVADIVKAIATESGSPEPSIAAQIKGALRNIHKRIGRWSQYDVVVNDTVNLQIKERQRNN
jgi:hypothetical protein